LLVIESELRVSVYEGFKASSLFLNCKSVYKFPTIQFPFAIGTLQQLKSVRTAVCLPPSSLCTRRLHAMGFLQHTGTSGSARAYKCSHLPGQAHATEHRAPFQGKAAPVLEAIYLIPTCISRHIFSQ
jgi:hypothetical protein